MKILYLTSKFYWEHKMSRGRAHQALAIGENRDVELRVWGKGFSGYDDELPIRENLNSCGWDPDVIDSYKAEDHKGLDEVDCPKTIIFNECWHVPNTVKEIKQADADLIVCHHANDIERIKGHPHLKGRTIVHIPHAARADIFERAAKPWKDRDIPLLVTGVISDEIYPLRGKFKRLICEDKIPGRLRGHPGYRLPTMQACDMQFWDYAKELGRTKIAVLCASKYNYPLAKYVEAAMAGCAIIGDVPDEFRGNLSHGIHEVSSDARDERLISAVTDLIENDELAESLGREGQRYATSHFEMRHFAQQYVDQVDIYL